MIIRIFTITTFIFTFLLSAPVFAGGIVNGKIDISQVNFIDGEQKEVVLNSIPRKTKSFEFAGVEYFCHMGNYFIVVDEKFKQVAPPNGLKIKNICEGYERIIKGSSVVYYAHGIFYYQKPKQKEFTVINGPIGSKICKIPEAAVKVKIDGKDYYAYYNTIFKATPTRSRDMYTLVGYIDK